MAVPVVILILLGLVSFSRFGSATHFTWVGFAPHVQVRDLVFWSTIFFAFAGCEMRFVMGDEIKDARRVVPRSLVIAGVIITLSYIAGTVSMLVALPSSRISGLGGFMTAIDFLCRQLGLTALDCAGSRSWWASAMPARLRLIYHPRLGCLSWWGLTTTCLRFSGVSTRDGKLRTSLSFLRHGGIVFGLLSQAGTSVKGAYDLLVQHGFDAYFIPYLFVFASMIRLHRVLLCPARCGAWRQTVVIHSRASGFLNILSDHPFHVSCGG